MKEASHRRKGRSVPIIVKHVQLRLLPEELLCRALHAMHVCEITLEEDGVLSGVALEVCNSGGCLGAVAGGDVDGGIVGEEGTHGLLANSGVPARDEGDTAGEVRDVGDGEVGARGEPLSEEAPVLTHCVVVRSLGTLEMCEVVGRGRRTGERANDWAYKGTVSLR